MPDAFTPPLYPQWKRDHPDALLGKKEDFGKYAAGLQRRWWAGVNFNRADVRKRTVELIAEVARNYDVDAIDLDWLRHPIHFPETLIGKPVTRKQFDLITGLVREVRKLVGEVGEARGRPMLLSSRVPLTIEQGLYMGTDVETWLKEGLVDLLCTGGGYVPFSMPTAEIASIARPHGVPVYPCVSNSGMIRRKPYGPGTTYAVEGWRAVASNAFAAGADGISLFNLFPVPGRDDHNRFVREVFTQTGDPKTLAGKDKLFCLDNAAHMATHGYINHVVPHAQCLPKPIEPGKATTAALPVGEKLTGARAATLRVQVDRQARVTATFNGQRLSLRPAQDLTDKFGMVWFAADVQADTVRRGQNKFQIELSAPAEKPVRLSGLELLVRYT